MQEISQLHLFEYEGKEWLLAKPWIGGLFRAGLRAGILVDREILYERDPSGFWEWVLSWFGWQFQEVVREIHLDVLRLVLLMFMIVFGVSVFTVLCMGMVTLVSAFIRGLWKKVRKLISMASYGMGYIFRLLASSMDPGDLYRVVLPPITALSYNTESIRPNSVLTKFAIPDCQVLLGTLSGDRFVAHGCGVRVDVEGAACPFIITPLHVYEGLNDDFAVRGQKGTVSVSKSFLSLGGSKSCRECYGIDTDICAFPLTPVEASTVSVKKSRIVNIVAGSGALARVVGPTSEGSTGVVREDPYVFGRLIYDGSTVAGFSGAAYIVGTSVLGVHAAGGARNVGYSLRLAYITLMYLLKVKPEETSDWLRDVITRKKKKIFVDLTWGHSDSKRIRVNGEYHIVPNDEWQAAAGDLDVKNTGALEYDDSLRVGQSAESGEVSLASKNSISPVVMPGSSTSTALDQDPTLSLQKEIAGLKKSVQSLVDKNKHLGTELKKISAGQTDQPTVAPA